MFHICSFLATHSDGSKIKRMVKFAMRTFAATSELRKACTLEITDEFTNFSWHGVTV